MEIRFLGPLGKVTGSCTWMRDEARGWNFLIDCGMQQGEMSAAQWNACDWPFNPCELQFVVLTHAHIDHCGLLPMLYQRGFSGTVYCPRETRELATALLKDAARLSGLYRPQEVDRINWHEHKAGPLLGGYHPVARDLFLRYFRTGHVLGAVSVVVCWGDKEAGQRRIAFSGDLGPGREDHEYLPFLRHRMWVGACHYAVVESTYGATLRLPEQQCPEHRRQQLRRLLERALQQDGTLLIPAFALGRTQDVLFDLHWIVAESPERYGAIDFYLDAPTASRLHPMMLEALARTESNGKHQKVRPLWLGKQMFRWFGLDDTDPLHIQRVLDLCAMALTDKSQGSYSGTATGNHLARAWRPLFSHVSNRALALKTSRKRASVVVASAGSCEGGPAATWAQQVLRSERGVLAFAGYCSADTVGGQLLELGALPASERRRHAGLLVWPQGGSLAYREVKAGIEALQGYSAHADQAGLLAWLFEHRAGAVAPLAEQVFIQHGGDHQRRALAEAISHCAAEHQLEVGVCLPCDPQQWFDLEPSGSDAQRQQQALELNAQIAALQSQLTQLGAGAQAGSATALLSTVG